MNIIKEQFLLDPTVCFLNHGSFGATPLPVFQKYQEWQRVLENQPVEFLGRKASDLLRIARDELANFLHAQTDDIVFVTNATYGINTIARSLVLHEGDEVLSTNHEYGAVDRTWKFLASKQGFKYINYYVNTPVESRQSWVENFWRGVTSQTKVINLSHITSPTTLIFPVEEICQRARSAGIITVIDGAHGPGQIDLDLSSLQADFYTGNLHKWLCASKGSAFLYAAPSAQHLIEPLVVSWGWQSDNPGPSKYVDYMEWNGTRDISAFLAVPDAIRFFNQNIRGIPQNECRKMVTETSQRICEITGLAPLSIGPVWTAQMGSSVLPENIDGNWLKNELYEKHRIEIPVIWWEDHWLIRYSYQIYNSQQDMDHLITCLESILHNLR
ncbi:MAG TPA: aminotransferase class V-fold PLP-dependent enzyme [Longilinea sp.]|nr:aminotransferase class V-fold PLP-dependent enzyme [Longilinea sp.]